MAGAPPVVRKLHDIPAYRISPDDTVRLAELAGPKHGSSTSVFLEIWEPEGAQPVNSHEDSAEIFIVLRGRAQAHSDDHVVELAPGDVLVLQPGSEHRIVNTSTSERLITITVMADDGGFSELVTGGSLCALDAEDRRALMPSVETS